VYDNSNGHFAGSARLVDVGASFVPLFQAGDRVVATALEPGTSWILWDSSSRMQLMRGLGKLFDAAGDVFAVSSAGTVVDQYGRPKQIELHALSDGHLVGTVVGLVGYSGMGLADDGSYLWALDSNGTLSTWHPDGTPGFSFVGTYPLRPTQVYASGARLSFASGPAGSAVIESVNMSTGAQSVTSSAFSGTFAAWFNDGSHFLTRAFDQLIRAYTATGQQVAAINVPASDTLGGWGNYFWTSTSTTKIYAFDADPNAPVPVHEVNGVMTVASNGVGTVWNGPDASLIHLAATITDEPLEVPLQAPGVIVADGGGRWAALNFRGALYHHGTIASGTAAGLLGCGLPTSVAGSDSGLVVVSTASGQTLTFDVSSKTLTGAISPLTSDHLALSADGQTLLASNTTVAGDRELYAYGLPLGSLNYTWPAPVANFRLSRNGTRVSRACSAQITDAMGNSASSVVPNGDCAVPRLSPNGLHVAVSDMDPFRDAKDSQLIRLPKTSIYSGSDLVAIVPGYALGWLDDNQLLVQSYDYYHPDPFSAYWRYNGTTVYDSQANQTIALQTLPNMTDFYPISGSQLFSVSDGNIYDVTTGGAVHFGGTPAHCLNLQDRQTCGEAGFPSNYALAGGLLVQANYEGVFLASH
jgi:hypothetical protein